MQKFTSKKHLTQIKYCSQLKKIKYLFSINKNKRTVSACGEATHLFPEREFSASIIAIQPHVISRPEKDASAKFAITRLVMS